MKKIHKILGLVLVLFMVWMAISGVVLNHRSLFARSQVSRDYLPSEYQYSNWNYGFFKGSVKVSADSILLYGNEGIWLSDSGNTFIREMNNGIREGADNRKVTRVVKTSSGQYYCSTLFDLYIYNAPNNEWEPVPIPDKLDRISDMEVVGDTVVVLTRSEILLNEGDGRFVRKEISPTPDLDEKRSLFRLLWTLHSGELFGIVGKIVVDGIAIILVFISITGLLVWLYPKIIRRRKKKELPTAGSVRSFRFSWKWHNKIGYWFTLPLLIVAISGSFLRPPLLIAISKARVTPPPMTTMRTENPWHDLLRSIRYDQANGNWLLYTSEGFFTLATLSDTPGKLTYQPPVSVMGLNVFQPVGDDFWIVGSFNGLLLWNAKTGELIDGLTGMPYRAAPGGMPFGNYKVSGFTADFNDKAIVFIYEEGAISFDKHSPFIEMPTEYSSLPMSFWNLALEMHTGRIFTILGMASILYPFLLGLLTVFLLYSGWIVYYKRKKKKR